MNSQVQGQEGKKVRHLSKVQSSVEFAEKEIRLNLLMGKRVQIRPMREMDLEGDTEWARMNPEKLREYYWRSQEEPQLGPFVILNEDRERIGRIEYTAYRPSERRTQCNIFLSERYTGRGYGADALSTFSTFLFETLEINAIGLIVNMKNERAIRCYQKCGYKIRHRFPDKEQFVMILERPGKQHDQS